MRICSAKPSRLEQTPGKVYNENIWSLSLMGSGAGRTGTITTYRWRRPREMYINPVKSKCARRVASDPSIFWVLGMRKIRTRAAPSLTSKNSENDECDKGMVRRSMLKLKRPWSAMGEWHCCLTLTWFHIGISIKSNNRSDETQSGGTDGNFSLPHLALIDLGSANAGRIEDHYTL